MCDPLFCLNKALYPNYLKIGWTYICRILKHRAATGGGEGGHCLRAKLDDFSYWTWFTSSYVKLRRHSAHKAETCVRGSLQGWCLAHKSRREWGRWDNKNQTELFFFPFFFFDKGFYCFTSTNVNQCRKVLTMAAWGVWQGKHNLWWERGPGLPAGDQDSCKSRVFHSDNESKGTGSEGYQCH